VPLMLPRGNPVEADAAKEAYRRREELLSREEARVGFPNEKVLSWGSRQGKVRNLEL
jgi:hypothetical protein